MSDDLEGFAEWRDNMESRVSTLEATAEIEARARAQMDTDISDMSVKLDAQGRLLQALADTQSEHTAILAEHTAILADHTARLTRLETGQAKVLAGVQAIIGLLDGQDNLTD